MSNTEIQEGNKLIAEFTGMKKYYHSLKDNIDHEQTWYIDDPNKEIYTADLKYHSSWDWFMPAWEKFRKCIDITGNPTEKYYQQYSQHCQQIATAIAHITIEESFARLVKAIQWYNQNKKP